MSDAQKEYDYMFKLVIVGDSGVGKSSILIRFTDDQFADELGATIGVDFKTTYLTLGSKTINLTIWDTAGQEKFKSLTSSYYRGAQGMIFVYDVSSIDSFQNIPSWLKEVEANSTGTSAIKMLIGNKVDKEERHVTKEMGMALAREHQMLFIECSAKTKVGIQQAFEELVQKILDNPSLYENERPRKLEENSQTSTCC